MRSPRFSIAGLMGIVLVAAVGLAALRSPTPAWAGTIFMTTFGVFGLAIVGAIYRSGAARAWWIGFCVFGLGYLVVVGASRSEYRFPQLPTSQLLVALSPMLGHPAELVTGPQSRSALGVFHFYVQIGHALWSLMIALLGGALVRIFLARPAGRPEGPGPDAPVTARRPRKSWLRPAVIAWAGLVLAAAAAAIRSGPDAGIWAGATFFLTCGLFGLACLVAIFGRGRRRQAGVGAALFGIGYLWLAFARAPYQLLPPGQIVTVRSLYQPLPTSSLLDGLRSWVPAIAGGHAASNARILRALEQPVPMTFPDPTPLKDVLKYVTAATTTPTYSGIPIYIDVIGLKEAEVTPASTVKIDLLDVPLKTSLRLSLEPLGLDYRVQDGCVRVTKAVDPGELDSPGLIAYSRRWNRPGEVGISSDLDDPFLVAGHCLLALFAAAFGALLAPLVAEASIHSNSSPERASDRRETQ